MAFLTATKQLYFVNEDHENKSMMVFMVSYRLKVIPCGGDTSIKMYILEGECCVGEVCCIDKVCGIGEVYCTGEVCCIGEGCCTGEVVG